MAICSCMLPLVNPKACEQCPNRTEPFDFIPISNNNGEWLEDKGYVAPTSEPLFYINPGSKILY